MSKPLLRTFLALALAALCVLPVGAARAAADGRSEALVVMTGRADLGGLSRMPTRAARGAEVMLRKQAVAERQQAALLQWLSARGIEHRPYWIANAIWVRATEAELAAISQRADVRGLAGNPHVSAGLPTPQPASKTTFSSKSLEWGNSLVNAATVWGYGVFGQGAVVAGADTGYKWDHPALKQQYRGWDGESAEHGYNWHDAIHGPFSGGTNSCGYDSAAPCDDDSHGTHTMGTMVGDDGNENQIGVAPQARWIGCRNMERGVGSPTTYIECFQWFIAPTDADGQNPDPSRAPDVIGNSWSCTSGEGCNTETIALLEEAVEATHAAGILVVAAAGNSGSLCGTVSRAPGSFPSVLTVGATNSSDQIASFSSRGPTLSGLLKPDVSAPGVQVRSSVPPSSYAMYSGTSMATPHVVGVAALVLTAAPNLKGKPDALAAVLKQTALPRMSGQTCVPYPGASIPNAVYGYGRVDASAAYDLAYPPIFSDEFE